MAVEITTTNKNNDVVGKGVMLTIANNNDTPELVTILFSTTSQSVTAKYYLTPYQSKRVNVKDYVDAVLDIQPLPEGTDNAQALAFNRIVEISYAPTSFLLQICGGVKDLIEPMTDFKERTIAPGQVDEISMFDGDTVYVNQIKAGDYDFRVKDVWYRIKPMGNGVRLCWVNKYGAIDYYNFINTIKVENKIEKTTVLLRSGWHSDVTNSENLHTVSTGAISDDDAAVVSYLLRSPKAWLVGEDNIYTPIDITIKTITSFNYGKLTNLSITYRLAKDED